MHSTKNKLSNLRAIITKIPLEVCCVTVLPEFGVQWKEVFRAVRNARLPMQSSSIARVLCQYAMSLPQEALDEILSKLKLKLVASQTRTWHVLHLQEPTNEEPVTKVLHMLPQRVLAALRSIRHKGRRPEVQSMTLGDLVYMSVQFVSQSSEGSALYVATPPGQPVALVSSIAADKLLRACAEGLGYSSYTVANLHGKHIPSLLRVADPAWGADAAHLAAPLTYEPAPALLPNGIDYTNRSYDENYVHTLIGPNPPLLTDLKIKTTRSFFDRSLCDKTINLTVTLKSDDIAKSLRTWVTKGAITPTSDFFQIFHKIKSNKITYNKEDSD